MDRNNNEPPFFQLIQFIDMLMNFCLFGAILGITSFFLSDDDFHRGEWLGIGVTCLMIYLSFILTMINSIPKEELDEMIDEIKREIEEEEKENEKDDESK